MLRKVVPNTALLVFVLSLGAFALQGAPEKREPGFRFFADLDAAISEARDRNVPLMVALHKDK